MPACGTWSPYVGKDVFLLAAVLLVIGGALAYLGARLHRPLGVTRPGWAVGIMLVVIWVLAYADLGNSQITYYTVVVQQVGRYKPPTNPTHGVNDV